MDITLHTNPSVLMTFRMVAQHMALKGGDND